MRALPFLLAIGLLAVPFAAAGATGCWLLPPGAFPGAGACQKTFAAGPGLIHITIETLYGSVGEVVIEGKGPQLGNFATTCTLAYSSGTCTPPISFFMPAPGTWTVTAAATNANFESDSRVWMAISYPDFP